METGAGILLRHPGLGGEEQSNVAAPMQRAQRNRLIPFGTISARRGRQDDVTVIGSAYKEDCGGVELRGNVRKIIQPAREVISGSVVKAIDRPGIVGIAACDGERRKRRTAAHHTRQIGVKTVSPCPQSAASISRQGVMAYEIGRAGALPLPFALFYVHRDALRLEHY